MGTPFPVGRHLLVEWPRAESTTAPTEELGELAEARFGGIPARRRTTTTGRLSQPGTQGTPGEAVRMDGAARGANRKDIPYEVPSISGILAQETAPVRLTPDLTL